MFGSCRLNSVGHAQRKRRCGAIDPSVVLEGSKTTSTDSACSAVSVLTCAWIEVKADPIEGSTAREMLTTPLAGLRPGCDCRKQPFAKTADSVSGASTCSEGKGPCDAPNAGRAEKKTPSPESGI